MKRILAIALVGIASMFPIGNASAQNHPVQATVPFNFNVGSQVLPANTYIVTSTLHGLIEVQSKDKRSVASATVLHIDTQTAGSGKLVFVKVGDRYFLHQVLCPSSSINADLLTSNFEKKTRRQQSSLKVGEIAGETILVAAE